jgi:molybdopterin synthase sulfur carrier subunit
MPAVTLRLPVPLQSLAEGQPELAGEAATVGALLDEVGARYPALMQRIRSRDGALRPYVNVFVRRTDIRHLDGQDTPLEEGDEVVIMPSVAGG